MTDVDASVLYDKSTNLVRSKSTPLKLKDAAEPARGLRHKSSGSFGSSKYTQVNYIRSQPLGLATSSLPSPQTSPAKDASTERDSSQGPRVRLTRSDSLPSFPPEAQPFQPADPFRLVGKLHELPANPKNWIPSQLAVYLSHVLKLTPTPVINDLVAFVIESRMSGRKFLRLRSVNTVAFSAHTEIFFREKDFRALDINPARVFIADYLVLLLMDRCSWARIMSQARDRLRIECLQGRILTSGEGLEDLEETDTMAGLQPPEEDSSNWKNSWRRTTGANSRGRTKGISAMFERPSENSANRSARSRQASAESSTEPDSDTESISSEADISIDWSSVQPLAKETASPKKIQSEHGSSTSSDFGHSTDDTSITNYPTIQIKPPASLNRLFSDDSEDAGTLKSPPMSLGKNAKANTLADIFACADKASEGLEEMTKIKSQNGSMVVVKKSQLQE